MTFFNKFFFSAIEAVVSTIGAGCANSEPPTNVPTSFEELDPSVTEFAVSDIDGHSLEVDRAGRYFVSPVTPPDPTGAAEKLFACAPYLEYCNPTVWHAGTFCYMGVCSPITIGIIEPVVATSTCSTPVAYMTLGTSGHAGHSTTPSNIVGQAQFKAWEQCGVNLCNAPQGESCNW